MATGILPSKGTNVDKLDVEMDTSCPLEKLPNEASSVSYHYGGGRNPNTFYEFDVDEKSFLKWVEAMPRFKPLHSELLTYRFNQSTNSPELHIFTDGFAYEWNHPTDGDQGEHIAYDKSIGRAFYQYHLF